MDFFKHKVGIIVALASIAAVAAVVWFCLAGGNRQSGHGGTLVRINGVPVCGAELPKMASEVAA